MPWGVGAAKAHISIIFLCTSLNEPSVNPSVVHCVRVSLIDTTVAPSWAHWSVVWDWFAQLPLLCGIIRGNGAPLNAVVMGPRPGNVAKGISSVLLIDYVIFSLGICVSISLSAQSTRRRRTAWQGRNIWFRRMGLAPHPWQPSLVTIDPKICEESGPA